MRAEAALADRRREVRLAARGWRRAGAIDEKTLAAIDAAYADDRARLGPMFRTLAFLLGLLALNAFFLLIGLLSGGQRAFAVACLVFSLMLAGATELLVGRSSAPTRASRRPARCCASSTRVSASRSRSSGALPDRALVGFVLLAVAVLSRWPAGAGVRRCSRPWRPCSCSSSWPGFRRAACCGSSSRLPPHRCSCGRASAPACRRSTADPAWSRSCSAIGAFYGAVHVGSWDHALLEVIADFGPAPRPAAGGCGRFRSWRPRRVPWPSSFSPSPRAAASCWTSASCSASARSAPYASTSTWPRSGWCWSAPARRRCSPRCCCAGCWLAGPTRERGGFTAEPLYEDASRRRVGEVVAAMAAFAPAARTIPAGEPGLKAGGGRYGGGGATSDF